MKAIHFCLTFLVAVPIWAHSKFPMGFFAKFNGTLRPLSGTNTEVNGVFLNLMSFGSSYNHPTRFSIEGTYAVTGDSLNKMYLGFFNGILGFSPNIGALSLRFDKKSRLRNGSFKACALVSDTLYDIFDGSIDITDTPCFMVQIYYLSYEPKTGTAVKDSSGKSMTPVFTEKVKPKHRHKKGKNHKQRKHEKEKEEEEEVYKSKGKTVLKKIPPNVESLNPSPEMADAKLVFCAKVNGNFVPLSEALYDAEQGLSVLTYGSPGETPVMFALRANLAITHKNHTITNARCAITQNTYKPGFFGLFEGMIGVGPNFPSLPLEFNKRMRLILASFQSCAVSGQVFRVIVYATPPVPHTDCFDVNIYLLPYNKLTRKVKLPKDVKKDRKETDRKENDRKEKERKEKDRKEKHSGKDKTKELPKEKSSEDKKNHGSRKKSKSLFKQKTHGEEKTEVVYDVFTGKGKGMGKDTAEGIDKGIDKDTAEGIDKDTAEGMGKDATEDTAEGPKGDKPRSADFPLFFAAQVNNFLVPLSSKLFEPYSSENSVFTHSDLENVHVECNLHNNFAFATHGLTPGYVGFSNGYFVFGPTIEKEVLNLNPKGKVLNYPFYSCMGSGAMVRGIAHSMRPTEDCFPVDIYLLPYNKTSSEYEIPLETILRGPGR